MCMVSRYHAPCFSHAWLSLLEKRWPADPQCGPQKRPSRASFFPWNAPEAWTVTVRQYYTPVGYNAVFHLEGGLATDEDCFQAFVFLLSCALGSWPLSIFLCPLCWPLHLPSECTPAVGLHRVSARRCNPHASVCSSWATRGHMAIERAGSINKLRAETGGSHWP